MACASRWTLWHLASCAATVALAVTLCGRPAFAESERAAMRLEAVYGGPAVAPLLGVAFVLGAEWRVGNWLSVGAELGLHDQSPLRTNATFRLLVLAGYTFEFGGYGAVRLGSGYRHAFLHGDTYRVEEGQARASSHRGFGLWSSALELDFGYDFDRQLGWPVRLSVAPGTTASFPILEGFGVDFWVTSRLAILF